MREAYFLTYFMIVRYISQIEISSLYSFSLAKLKVFSWERQINAKAKRDEWDETESFFCPIQSSCFSFSHSRRYVTVKAIYPRGIESKKFPSRNSLIRNSRTSPLFFSICKIVKKFVSWKRVITSWQIDNKEINNRPLTPSRQSPSVGAW